MTANNYPGCETYEADWNDLSRATRCRRELACRPERQATDHILDVRTRSDALSSGSSKANIKGVLRP